MKFTETAGFSLVELLVVIAIIAVLCAMLFPVLTSARETAKKANCASNERQIGVAFIAYADDNRETLPPARIRLQSWDRIIASYIRNDKVFKCPSDRIRRDPGRIARSYSMNDPVGRYYIAHNIQVSQIPGMKLAWVPSTSQYVLMTEMHVRENVVGGLSKCMHYRPLNENEYGHGSDAVKCNNFLFFDGSVRFLPHSRIDDKTNYQVFAE